MKRCFLFLLALAALSAPAGAEWRLKMSGDPTIDAQWAAQLRRPPAVHGSRIPVDLGGRSREGRYRVIVAPAGRPAAVHVAPAQAARVPVVRPRALDPAYLPAIVEYSGREGPGTVVIDTRDRYLYLVLEGGKAQRYGVGVGRDGFGWSGTVKVGRKAEWPTWTPPAAMRKRQPYLPVSMPGGPDNPLGARALYLYDSGRDTLFRIHGSNEPWTIGQAVSSGCFRMRNEDVTELYARVKIGAQVVVR